MNIARFCTLLIFLVFLVLPFAESSSAQPQPQEPECMQRFNQLNNPQDMEAWFNRRRSAFVVELGATYNNLSNIDFNKLIEVIVEGIEVGCSSEIEAGQFQEIWVVSRVFRRIVRVD